jgi:hypothetical protein
MIDRKRGRAAILAGILLVAAVAGSGLAGVAAADTVSKTVDAEGAAYVAANISEVTGSFTVKVWVDPAPGGGQQLVYNGTHDAANIGTDTPAYRNSKAYDNVTIEISGSGVPSSVSIGTGDDFARSDWRNKDVWTSSGGDRDFHCGLMERTSQTVNPAIEITDCNPLPGTTTANTTSLNNNETRLELYQTAASQANAADVVQTMMANRLEDTETVALVNHGKPAYIEELNQGTGETTAQANATKEIREYYSVLERNYLAEWNAQVNQLEYLDKKRMREGLSDRFLTVPLEDHYDGRTGGLGGANVSAFGTTTYQLQNGTTIDVRTVTVRVWFDGDKTSYNTYTMAPTTGMKRGSYYDGREDGTTSSGGTNPDINNTIERVAIPAPSQDYEQLEYLTFMNYSNKLSAIDSQTTSAVNQMETVVNQTYDGYEAGTINMSDLVTPAMVAGSYSPNTEFSGYAAATLANLGVSMPENYSQLGHMNVSFNDSTTDRGLIVAQNNPPGGSFQVGTEYDPANITGAVFFIDNEAGEIREVTEPFTITDAVTNDGGNLTKVTIDKRTYQTTSSDELKALYDQIAEDQAEINARLSALVGGGGPLGGASQQTLVIIALIGGGLILVGRN